MLVDHKTEVEPTRVYSTNNGGYSLVQYVGRKRIVYDWYKNADNLLSLIEPEELTGIKQNFLATHTILPFGSMLILYKMEN